MALINLTRQEFKSELSNTELKQALIPLSSANTKYTGVVYFTKTDSMLCSYLDLPGHILETDDGQRGNNIDAADYFRVDTTVLHLGVGDGHGAVTAEDLEKANAGSKVERFLIVHALGGTLNPHDVDWQSVYLDTSAVNWIINSGCKVLISDIYESKALDGVFLKLFEAGISTVCEPYNLFKIPGNKAKITIAFQPIPSPQVPITMLAETVEE